MTDWHNKLSTLSQVGIRESKLQEIRKLAAEIPMNIGEDKIEPAEKIIYLSTKYWEWYPYHFANCPDADTGDLTFNSGDWNSRNIQEIKKAFSLLEKVIYFVQNYQPTDLSILVGEK